jgi:hypothetical protein
MHYEPVTDDPLVLMESVYLLKHDRGGAVGRCLELRESEWQRLRAAVEAQAARNAKLRKEGAALANCAFNLAQHPGRKLTAHDAMTLDKARKRWDEADRIRSEANSPEGREET